MLFSSHQLLWKTTWNIWLCGCISRLSHSWGFRDGFIETSSKFQIKLSLAVYATFDPMELWLMYRIHSLSNYQKGSWMHLPVNDMRCMLLLFQNHWQCLKDESLYLMSHLLSYKMSSESVSESHSHSTMPGIADKCHHLNWNGATMFDVVTYKCEPAWITRNLLCEGLSQN